MILNVDLTVLIGVLSTLLGIVVTILKLKKDDNQEIKEKALNESKVGQEIFYISKNIEDIKYNQRSLTTEMKVINERLIKAEESIKNAHNRIDHIEEKGGY